MTNSEKVSSFRRRRKQALIKISGGKCNICGYNKVNSALEFHHINSQEKKYGLAQNGTCHSLQKDLQQLDKCILVCANCHREIHAGLYSNQELYNYKIIDEEYRQKILLDNQQKKTRKIKYCKDCGKELCYGTMGDYCNNCIGTHRRIYERPSREEFKEKIRILPLTKVAQFYGVSDVRKWCDDFNLPRTKKEINSYSDNDWQKI